MTREASAIMAKGTSNLVKARAKLHGLEKVERAAIKARDKLSKAADKAIAAADKQRARVEQLTPAQSAPADTDVSTQSA